MTLRKLTSTEKIFLSLVINILAFGGIFALKLLGLTTNTVLLMLAMAISVEVIYLAFFIQMSVNKNSQSLTEMEKHLEGIRLDEEKTYTALIYTGHQVKNMQHELNAYRKGHALKSNGNGHLPKMHS